MANLLIETNLFEGKINEDDSGRTIVKGILQRAGAENQNGRIYPKPILMREAKKYETLIKERRALGELDHPDSSVINLKNVSHNVREIHWDNDDLVGTVEILPTPSGNILKELLKADMELIIMAAFSGLAKAEKSLPNIMKKGAPGGWPTSNLFAVVIYSPQSQRLVVCSMVDK